MGPGRARILCVRMGVAGQPVGAEHPPPGLPVAHAGDAVMAYWQRWLASMIAIYLGMDLIEAQALHNARHLPLTIGVALIPLSLTIYPFRGKR